MAAAAAKERLTHRGYLAEVLTAEVDERDTRRRARRVVEARFPRVKRLADFDCGADPAVGPATIATLAAGAFIDASEPLCLIGDSGTGKSHLLIGTGIAAAEAGRRVRYVTCAALVNELAEAAMITCCPGWWPAPGASTSSVWTSSACPPGPQGGRAVVPGHHRKRGEGVGGRGFQRQLQRVGRHVLRSSPRRRCCGSDHFPGPHHRDRKRGLPPAHQPDQGSPGQDHRPQRRPTGNEQSWQPQTGRMPFED